MALALLLPASGKAYCRTTTVEAPASGCPEPCVDQGLPLHWPTRELSYTLNRNGFPGLSDRTLRDILDRSFGAWEQVQCEDGPIDLSIEQRRETTPLFSGPREQEPNENVIAFVPAAEWDGDRHAFAITKIWYNGRNGHILGADMLFNGNMAPFGICPEPNCPRDEITDLENVVTHEAGHFLGLAHSSVPNSTMWCDAAPGDTDKRSLEPDDIRGLCAIYGEDYVPLPSQSASTGSCSAGPFQSGSGGLGLLALAALAGLLAGRRRPA